MANLPIKSSGGSTSATAINSAVSTSSSAWGTAQNVAFTAPGLTLSLPTPMAGDIAPTLKTIVISNTGTNAFIVELTGGSIISAIGLTVNPGSVWTFTAQTLTTASVSATNAAQGVVTEYGEQVLSGSVSVPTGSTSPTVSTDILSFTLPSAGTWDVDFVVRGLTPGVSTSGACGMATVLTDNSNNVIANTELKVGRESFASVDAITLDLQFSATGKAQITTAGATTYKIRGYHDGSSGSTGPWVAQSDNNGRTKVSWTKIMGHAPVAGQTVDYVYAVPVASVNLAVNAAVPFTSVVSGNLTSLGAGLFRLKAGKTYSLEAAVSVAFNANDTSYQYQWFNVTAGALIGSANSGGDVTGLIGSAGTAVAVISPTAPTDVEVRIISDDATTLNPLASYLKIVQLGTSAIAGVALLPAQTGNGGKVLQTDGTIASWQTPATGAPETLPAVGAITKGRPVAWFDNAGTPSVRDALSTTTALTSPYTELFTAPTSANHKITFIGGHNNSGLLGRFDDSFMQVSVLTFNQDGTLNNSNPSAINGTLPFQTNFVSGATNLSLYGPLQYALFAIAPSVTPHALVGASLAGGPVLLGSPYVDATPYQRVAVCPSSRLTGNGFWLMGTNFNNNYLWHAEVDATGNVTNQTLPVNYPSGGLSGNGQCSALYYTNNAPGSRDRLWHIKQDVGGTIAVENFMCDLDGANFSGANVRLLLNANPGSAGTLQVTPCRSNGARINIAFINTSGELAIGYVDGTSGGTIPTIASIASPNFPGVFDIDMVQVCPKDYNVHDLPFGISAGAPISGSSRFVVSYEDTVISVVYFWDVTFNWSTLTFTTNSTTTISDAESNGTASISRPSNIIGTLFDPVCFFHQDKPSSSAHRLRGVIGGFSSVNPNVLAIADATVIDGAPCPLAFNGKVVTGLTGLTPGAKHYIHNTTGAISTTSSVIPLYRALDSTRAVVTLNP